MNSNRHVLDGSMERASHDSSVLTNIQELYASPTHEPTLGDYWRILLKHTWTILVVAVVMVTVTGLISLRITPIYEATTRLSISGQAPNFLNFADKPQYSDSSEDQFSIDTQVDILQSDTLALQVIRNLGLDKRPEFTGQQQPNSNSVLSKLSPKELGHEEQLIQKFRGNLRVHQVPNTAIVEIKYSDPDPALAAEMANATAQIFIEQNIKARYDSTMQAADWLSRQLADLQIKVESSQARLIRYQKENSIIGPDDKQNLTIEKLDVLSKELTQAQSDRIQKESLYEVAKSNADTMNIVLQDPVLSSLRQQKNDLQAQDAQLSIDFGSSYPKVVEVRSRLKQIDAAYDKELQNGIRRVENDYKAASKREQMLQSAQDAQAATANNLNINAIQYKLLKQEADSNRQLYDGLLEKLKEASLAAGLNSSNMRIVDKARVPVSPAKPNIPRNLEYALLIGLFGGIAAAFALEGMDRTVRTPDQVGTISALPTLAVIPVKNELKVTLAYRATTLRKATSQDGAPETALVAYYEPQSEIAEAYRALRTSILLSSAVRPPQSIVVTSPLPQDGKTMTSINIAIVMAQQAKRVLLVDADLRRPSIHRAFQLRPEVGLSDVLSGGASVSSAILATRQRNLFILPSGSIPPQPSELLSAPLMQDLLRRWREEYDHIIIDSPPVLSVTDAVLMSVKADAVILVVRSGQTTTNAVRRARDLLTHVNANLLGVVLNAADLTSLGGYYSGSQSSAYYTDSKRKDSSNGNGRDADGDEQTTPATTASS
jgi:succinoglycan biosynthesis transport protein ExoP